MGAVGLAPSRELAPIELFTADARIVAWIETRGQRVTDLLNERDELRLWRPAPTANGVDGVVPEPGPDDGDWQTVETESLMLAMPPEWRTNRQLRIHRKLRRVALEIGQFSITGNAHLSLGSEPGMWMVTRGPRFLPLTDAHILHRGDPPFEHVVSVVIINARQVSRLVPLFTLA
jgi:hypothetical protein